MQCLGERDIDGDTTPSSTVEQAQPPAAANASVDPALMGTSSQGSSLALSQNTRMTAMDLDTSDDEILDFDDDVMW